MTNHDIQLDFSMLRTRGENNVLGEKLYRLLAAAGERHSAASQKNYAMKVAEDGGTRLMYGAQDRAAARREGHHVRHEDAGRVRVLSRGRFIQEQYLRIGQ